MQSEISDQMLGEACLDTLSELYDARHSLAVCVQRLSGLVGKRTRDEETEIDRIGNAYQTSDALMQAHRVTRILNDLYLQVNDGTDTIEQMLGAGE